MLEVWKKIKGYENSYLISNKGRVKSIKRTIIYKNGTRRTIPEKVLKLSNTGGYIFVGLSLKGVQKSKFIHRLVAGAFIPNPKNKPQVNHIDGDKANNILPNLVWCTGSENIQHALDMGLKPRGESINTNILSEKEVLRICNILDTTSKSQREIGGIFGVHKDTVGAINTGKNWNWLTNRKDL